MSEKVRWIDIENWPRRGHFELFTSYAYPYFNLCADVDVSRLVRAVKARRTSFTAHLVHVLARAANAVPELRHRIREGGVVEHAVVHPATTVLADNDLFAFCFFDYVEDVADFVHSAVGAIRRTRENPSVAFEPRQDDVLYTTAIPWVSFTSMMHPVPTSPPDSIPRIAWGRFRIEGDRAPMPLSLHAHHGLVDGIHAGRFFEQVQRRLDKVEHWIPEPDGRDDAD